MSAKEKSRKKWTSPPTSSDSDESTADNEESVSSEDEESEYEQPQPTMAAILERLTALESKSSSRSTTIKKRKKRDEAAEEELFEVGTQITSDFTTLKLAAKKLKKHAKPRASPVLFFVDDKNKAEALFLKNMIEDLQSIKNILKPLYNGLKSLELDLDEEDVSPHITVMRAATYIHTTMEMARLRLWKIQTDYHGPSVSRAQKDLIIQDHWASGDVRGLISKTQAAAATIRTTNVQEAFVSVVKSQKDGSNSSRKKDYQPRPASSKPAGSKPASSSTPKPQSNTRKPKSGSTETPDENE